MAARIVVALLIVGLPGTAAAESSLPVQITYRSAVVAQGKQRPCITLAAEGRVGRVQVRIARRGKTHRKRLSGLLAGQRRDVCWRERPGRYTYRVTVTCSHEGAMQSKSLDVTIAYLPPIKILLDRKQVDLAARELVFRLNQHAARAELTIRGAGGRELLTAEQEYDGAAPGTPLRLTWDAVEGTITRMDLKVHGRDGFWTTVAIAPWSVSIPHEEVEFATDRWDLRPGETPKLDAAIQQIRKALREHGGEFAVKLYVAGFTDTVGSRSHNRTLSSNRARAIAAYFRRKGVKLPIFFRGYGEEALAVATRDETAEARNRRALYVLSAQPPRLSRHVKWGRWSPVR